MRRAEHRTLTPVSESIALLINPTQVRENWVVGADADMSGFERLPTHPRARGDRAETRRRSITFTTRYYGPSSNPSRKTRLTGIVGDWGRAGSVAKAWLTSLRNSTMRSSTWKVDRPANTRL